MTTKEMLLAAMKVGSVRLVYTKADGTRRVAQGTLNEKFIATQGATPKGDSGRVLSDLVCRYYDLEKEGWRSFTWTALTEPELTTEPAAEAA